MQKVKVLRGQTLYDIAVQWLGDAQAASAIANTNNLSITAELEAGTELVLPAGSAYYEPAAAHFRKS
jgi:LysM repeat protein